MKVAYSHPAEKSLVSGKMKRNRKWVMSFVILLLLTVLAAVLYGLKEYNRGPVNVAHAKPDFIVIDSVLLAEFENDEQQAMIKYNSKIIQVKGTVKEIERSNDIYSYNLGNLSSPSVIHCSLDSTQEGGDQKEGQQISLKGVFVGYNKTELLGSDILLIRCTLITE